MTPSVQGIAVGGSGGASLSGGQGGNGASETLINAISGSLLDEFNPNSGNLLLLQQVAGGGSSGGSNGGTVGTAGNATSSFTLSGPQNGNMVYVDCEADAGNGGASQNTTGGVGGNATASATGSWNTTLSVSAYANAPTSNFLGTGKGNGSDITAGTGTGGGGGSWTAILSATETGSGG